LTEVVFYFLISEFQELVRETMKIVTDSILAMFYSLPISPNDLE